MIVIRDAQIFPQFVRFASVGAAATLLQYLILIGLVELGDLRPAYASAIGYGLGACLSYVLNYRITFASRQPHIPALLRFGAVAGIGLMLNSVIIIFANEVLEINYLFAQIISTLLVLGWNFLANRLWTFRTRVARPWAP
jgi:putative flippase GtrA